MDRFGVSPATLLWWVGLPVTVVGPQVYLALADPFWFGPLIGQVLVGSVVALVFTRDVRSENYAYGTSGQDLVEAERGPDLLPESALGYLIRGSTTVGAWAFLGVVVALNLR